MEIAGYTYHILKSIQKRNSMKVSNLKRDFIGSKLDINLLIENLKENGIIRVTDDRVIELSDETRDFITEKEKEEISCIHKLVFNNYELALIEFLYNRNDMVHIDDFPEILITRAPQRGSSSPSFNLIQYLFQIQSLVKQIDHSFYQLNESGIAFYKNSRAKEERVFFPNTPKELNIVFHTVNNTTNGDGNTINSGANAAINSNTNINKK